MFEIYTDGGCDVNKSKRGAWHFVVLKNSELIFEKGGAELNSTTCNRMEYWASIQALSYLLDYHGPSPYVVYTDSQLLVNTANLWRHKWKNQGWRKSSRGNAEVMNLDLVILLDMLLDKHKGQFSWVKGHSGNKWNEHCDSKCTEIIEQYI